LKSLTSRCARRWNYSTGEWRFSDCRNVFECMDQLFEPSKYRRRRRPKGIIQRWSRRGRGGVAAKSLAIAIKDESVQCSAVRQYDIFLCRQWINAETASDGSHASSCLILEIQLQRLQHKHFSLFVFWEKNKYSPTITISYYYFFLYPILRIYYGFLHLSLL